VNGLMKAIERVLALAFIFAVCLNFANVIGRYVVGRSISGADEVQIYIMVWMAFLGAAVVAWRRTHLRMDVLVRFLPAALQTALRGLEVVLIVGLAGFTVVQSARYTWQMAALGRTSDVGGIPMWIPHSAVALGFALIAVVAVTHALRKR
jgi:TRAP-type C4-dicarboxylate transport system permease small subunit